MSAVPVTPKRTRGQRSWTDAQRAEQSRLLRSRQIWLKSTGPRTVSGKAISRCNALKHGATSRPAKDFMKHFTAYRDFLRLCWLKRAEIIAKQKNELIDPLIGPLVKEGMPRCPQRPILRCVRSRNLNIPPVIWHFVPLPALHSPKV